MVGVLFNLSLSAIEKPIQIIRRYSLNLLTKFLSNTLTLQMLEYNPLPSNNKQDKDGRVIAHIKRKRSKKFNSILSEVKGLDDGTKKSD